jgi:hypothetical protein
MGSYNSLRTGTLFGFKENPDFAGIVDLSKENELA